MSAAEKVALRLYEVEAAASALTREVVPMRHFIEALRADLRHLDAPIQPSYLRALLEGHGL